MDEEEEEGEEEDTRLLLRQNAIPVRKDGAGEAVDRDTEEDREEVVEVVVVVDDRFAEEEEEVVVVEGLLRKTGTPIGALARTTGTEEEEEDAVEEILRLFVTGVRRVSTVVAVKLEVDGSDEA